MKRATIKDVAARAGVSHPTVSRVIHDDPQIGEATKLRVRAIMKEIGYRPNLIARGLVRNKTQAFAIVIPDFNPHVQPIVRGIVDECRRRHYAPMLFSTEYWTEEEASYSYVAANWRVDGVLIYNVVHHERLTRDARQLAKEQIPFVFINKYLRHATINSVGVDNQQAVRAAVEHLAELGHKKMGCLNGSLMSVDGVERFEAFRSALAGAGLAYEERWTGNANFSDQQAAEEMRRILALRHRPTAMFCANDLMALGAMKAAQALNVRVPGELSFVGFDDLDAGQWFTPALTTLSPPLREVGGRALKLLVDMVEQAGRPPEQIPYEAKLIVRASTAPPAG